MFPAHRRPGYLTVLELERGARVALQLGAERGGVGRDGERERGERGTRVAHEHMEPWQLLVAREHVGARDHEPVGKDGVSYQNNPP